VAAEDYALAAQLHQLYTVLLATGGRESFRRRLAIRNLSFHSWFSIQNMPRGVWTTRPPMHGQVLHPASRLRLADCSPTALEDQVAFFARQGSPPAAGRAVN
jgi:hypothetical protein